MTAAPTPDPLDGARLAALDEYGILDTPAESGFEDIVLLASQACETPTALVSFVAKDRQWFKARIGFDPCETPLTQSVCAHALGRDGILVIPDLTRDPRTRDNALVTGDPQIRFYAGAPLHTQDGFALGTLCVIDSVPRPEGLTARQTATLTALARQVMVQLELRRAIENREQALAARARAEEQLRLAVEATGIGIFDFDLATGELRWDARVRALFGVPARGPITYAETYLGGVHPDDRERADAAVRAAMDADGVGVFDTDYRVIAADTGVERWLAARGRAIVEDGVAVRFIGSVRDITEHKAADLALKATEERYRLAARATTDAIWDWDLVADQVRWNEALTLAHGHDLGAVVPQGAWWLAQIHSEDRDRIARSIHAAIDGTVETWTDEYRFRRGDDSYAAVIDRGYIIRDDAGRAVRMIGAMLDITRRNETERRLRQNQAQLDTVLQTMPVGILLAEAPSGRIVFGNPRLERILGHPTVQAEDRDGYGAYRAYRADGSPVPPGDYPLARITAGEVDHAELEAHYQRPDGSRRWIEIIGEAVKDSNGVTIGAVVAVGDIEDRKRAAQQQDILHHELGHRLKNTLALVQAIATQTLRNVTDLDAAREALSARLVAMGKAHDILLSGESESAGMEAVLRGALSIHDDGGPQRFRLSGPDLAVGPKAALSLALMAHELATNAVKYGALSVPDGSVVLRWEVEGRDRADGSAVIHLLWREQGGPSVLEPTRKGFGTRLIERGLVGAIGGTVRLAYPKSGVTCTVTAPLSGLLES
ncbi:hypothetical protein AFCDBAGC_3879 [Methylobacterium cerastii]|uniref:Blue-light-activated histidine kinase n=1 Tax=Methylobacterium cerastii TaxID=932741 RepID=A0ABQ4QLS9_9HYPH|nr:MULTISPECIES: PAS domain-containing protein [Methylobacterium]TXN80392.1 PAS domain-containing protein [Methylobacterium sp. WL8]GJD45999.1 hypothetical protein AFCDBAGC_3879 [Methylobacterium cerastii]